MRSFIVGFVGICALTSCVFEGPVPIVSASNGEKVNIIQPESAPFTE